MTERERWQELDQQATPAPWVTLATMPDVDGRTTVMVGHDVGGGSRGLAEMYDDGCVSQYDAGFIAAARAGWPAAEEECEWLHAELRIERGFRVELQDLTEKQRDERDQLRSLIRQVRDRLANTEALASFAQIEAITLIDRSHLLDDAQEA